MPAWIDLTGCRYGRLLCVTYLGGSLWRCMCDCGAVCSVKAGHIRSGNTTSCGCRKRTVLGESTTKHGKAGTRVHRIWKAMKNRCLNPKTPRYKDYGGRGIKVCDRWMTFENFYADMGDPPAGRSIERNNNDGHYEPDNCRWATPAEQNRNRRHLT